jgi:hypothetical protein
MITVTYKPRFKRLPSAGFGVYHVQLLTAFQLGFGIALSLPSNFGAGLFEQMV